MKLIGFSVKNYRSISVAYKLSLTDYTVIVGPNNEGKSNILKALGLTLNFLTGLTRTAKRPSLSSILAGKSYVIGRIERLEYDWNIDFPKNLQAKKPDGRSEFTCEFKLNDAELVEFKERTNVNLNTGLKAKVYLDKTGGVDYDFLMKGMGKASLNKNRNVILEFINEKLLLQYIPAVRTSELAINIVEDLLERELSKLEEKPEFENVVEAITKIQQPIIDSIAQSLKESIKGFIPDVKNISIKNRENVGRLISASCSVYIDDGIETDLKLKGDGIISLTALSLLQHFSKQGSLNKGSILLIEEPESHLHPKAIHNLKKVLYEISNTNQVIVTTHSPIIIERLQIQQNIIVQDGKAKSAKNVKEIRDSLGITMSDNLSSAFLVLLVEGEDDSILLKPWLEEKSSKIKSAFKNATLTIDHLGGATNVGYKASLYKNALCNVVAYLDDDDSGRKGISEALSQDILKNNEYVLSTCLGMNNSELEDLINVEAYEQLILDDYGIDLQMFSTKFRNNEKQWSDRVRNVFVLAGKKNWDYKTECEIKLKVAKSAAALKLKSLNEHKANSIVSLVSTIEQILVKHDRK
jgi:putative ATP-dependent endonuclease of OLD family